MSFVVRADCAGEEVRPGSAVYQQNHFHCELLESPRPTRIAPHHNRIQSGGDMKTRTVVLSLAMCFVAVAVCYASDVQMGTWKLNEAESKIGAGAPKNTTVVYEAAGDNVKVTVDGTNADGTPGHSEWTGKFDGKDYPVTGDPTADTRSYKQVNDHTLALTNKKGGKVTTSGKIVVSADGKSRTVTASGTNSEGKKIKSTSVYDKQ
jgi:hypothetical protein